jgi:hypothetical protein
MNADRLAPRLVSAFILILLLTLPACAPAATPTFFRPPSDVTSPATLPPGPAAGAVTPIISLAETLTPAPIQVIAAPPCENNLTFLLDLTYEDNTVVLPGQSIDKQWLVQNNGSCNWDSRYRLRFIGGDSLGAPEDLPLYPARAGARITLRIEFTAPSAPGSYQSAWQAMSPDGTLFGEEIYLLVVIAQQ